jgi:capsular polysaccharide biosynthesis protein
LNSAKREDLPKKLEFRLNVTPKSNALDIRYETSNVELGMQILKHLNEALLEEFGKLVGYYQKEYETQLNLKNIEREKYLLLQRTYEENIKNIEHRITDLKSEIKTINQNTEYLIRDQQNFLSRPKDENEILSALVYSNTILQNKSLANSYKNQLNEYELKLESEKQVSFESEEKIKNIVNEIENLEFKKSFIQNIQVLQSPKRSEYPVKPKKRRIVMLGAMAGLFLTMFFAFFYEYIAGKNEPK